MVTLLILFFLAWFLFGTELGQWITAMVMCAAIAAFAIGFLAIVALGAIMVAHDTLTYIVSGDFFQSWAAD